jgi:hypothetical protein
MGLLLAFCAAAALCGREEGSKLVRKSKKSLVGLCCSIPGQGILPGEPASPWRRLLGFDQAWGMVNAVDGTSVLLSIAQPLLILYDKLTKIRIIWMQRANAPVWHAGLTASFLLPQGPLSLHFKTTLMISRMVRPRSVSTLIEQRPEPAIDNDDEPNLSPSGDIRRETFSRLKHELRLTTSGKTSPFATANDLILSEVFLVGLRNARRTLDTGWQLLGVDTRAAKFAQYKWVAELNVRTDGKVDGLEGIGYSFGFENLLIHTWWVARSA